MNQKITRGSNRELATTRVFLQLTPTDRHLLESQAVDNGLTMTSYVRWLIHREAKQTTKKR